MKTMLEKYCLKIVDKELFVEYYYDKVLEVFIDDMVKVCETFKYLNASKGIPNGLKTKELSAYAQGLAQKGAEYMLNLPIGKKAKSILTKEADDLVQKKEPKESYKNTILVLEDLVKLFKDTREKIIISYFLQENSLY